jgi:hypothetical protein
LADADSWTPRFIRGVEFIRRGKVPLYNYGIKMRPRLTDLTNSGSGAEEEGSTPAEYHQAMMCTRQAGKAIVRVVGRCDNAKENENLGASHFTSKLF